MCCSKNVGNVNLDAFCMQIQFSYTVLSYPLSILITVQSMTLSYSNMFWNWIGHYRIQGGAQCEEKGLLAMMVQNLSIVPALVQYHIWINSLHNPYAGSLFSLCNPSTFYSLTICALGVWTFFIIKYQIFHIHCALGLCELTFCV